MQETFLRAARSPQSIPWGMPHEEAWLVRVLINICRDGWRKQAVRSRMAAVAPPEIDHRSAESELVARTTIWRALDTLPPRRRAILVMLRSKAPPFRRSPRLLGIRARHRALAPIRRLS